MVGGNVVDIWIWDKKTVSIVVQENDNCLGVDLVKNENSLSIQRGDVVWWQSNIALWTPKDKSFQDRHIERIGSSYQVKDCITDQRRRHDE